MLDTAKSLFMFVAMAILNGALAVGQAIDRLACPLRRHDGEPCDA